MAACVRRDPDVVAAEVDGAPRLLHLRSWTYLALDDVGERIWALLAEPREEEGLVRALIAEFDGDEAVIRADVQAFVTRLHDDGFVVRD
jgi:hypothetical protein